MLRKESELRPAMVQVAAELQERLPNFVQSRKSLPPVGPKVSGSLRISASGMRTATELPPPSVSSSGSDVMTIPAHLRGLLSLQGSASASSSGIHSGTISSAIGEASTPPTPAPRRRRLSLMLAMGLIGLIAVSGSALLFLRGHRGPPTTVVNAVTPTPVTPTPVTPTPVTPTPVTPTPPAQLNAPVVPLTTTPTTPAPSGDKDKPLQPDPPTVAPPPDPTPTTEADHDRPAPQVRSSGKQGKTGKSGKTGRKGGKSRTRTQHETEIIN